jgi:hypothetical protein
MSNGSTGSPTKFKQEKGRKGKNKIFPFLLFSCLHLVGARVLRETRIMSHDA